jgi:hypothetical protein
MLAATAFRTGENRCFDIAAHDQTAVAGAVELAEVHAVFTGHPPDEQ